MTDPSPTSRRWPASGLALDLRSLALFRIGLAALLLIDLCQRAAGTTGWYSDAGLLPRSLAISAGDAGFSLLLASGSGLWAGMVIAIALLAALALALGWRSRTASFVLLLAMLSLNARNPLLLSGGDALLIGLLAWSLLLPVQRRVALDGAADTTAAATWLGVAGAAYLVYVTLLVSGSALLGAGADLWPSLLAVDHQASRLGLWLRDAEALVGLIAGSAWLLQLLLPLLIVLPFAGQLTRTLAVLLLGGFQLLLMLSLDAGLWPLAGLVALLPLLGSGLWDWLDRRWAPGAGLRIYYDANCAFCHAACLALRTVLLLPRAELAPAQALPRADALMRAHDSWVLIDAEQTAHLGFDAMIVLLRSAPLTHWWLAPLAALPPLRRAGERLYRAVVRHRASLATATRRLWQPVAGSLPPRRRLQLGDGLAALLLLGCLLAVGHEMAGDAPYMPPPGEARASLHPVRLYLPSPDPVTGWPVFAAETHDGERIDLLRPGQPLAWQPGRAEHAGAHRSRLLRRALLARDDEQLYASHAAWWCRQASDQGRPLLRIDLTWVVLDANRVTERRQLHRHYCPRS